MASGNEYRKKNINIADTVADRLREKVGNFLNEKIGYGWRDGKQEGVLTPIEYKFYSHWWENIFYAMMFREPMCSNVEDRQAVFVERVFSDNSISVHTIKLFEWGLGDINIFFYPQKWIDSTGSRYRMDFEFEAYVAGYRDRKVKLCLELDGHDYHERTPDQAKRDKDRDRNIRQLGYDVIHYTGTDISRRTDEIIGEVLDHIKFLVFEKLSDLDPSNTTKV